MGVNSRRLVLNPKISCDSLGLKPPTCTCLNDGGKLVISFVAAGYSGLAGSIGILSMTPTLKIIPSYVQTPDLPNCASGEVSTTARPCYPAG